MKCSNQLIACILPSPANGKSSCCAGYHGSSACPCQSFYVAATADWHIPESTIPSFSHFTTRFSQSVQSRAEPRTINTSGSICNVDAAASSSSVPSSVSGIAVSATPIDSARSKSADQLIVTPSSKYNSRYYLSTISTDPITCPKTGHCTSCF